MKKIIFIISILNLFCMNNLSATSYTISGGGTGTLSTKIGTLSIGDTLVILDNAIYYEPGLAIGTSDITIKGNENAKPTIYCTSPMTAVQINIYGITLQNVKIIQPNTNYHAVEVNDNNITIKNCEIIGSTGNTVSGIFNYDHNNIYIFNCNIKNFNHGIYNEGFAGSDGIKIYYNTIEYCTFGIYYQTTRSFQDIKNNTIVNNTYGLYITNVNIPGTEFKVINNIFYYNSAHDVSLRAGTSTFTVNYYNNCYAVLYNNNTGLITFNPSGNLNNDPLLTDRYNRDYTLQANSPCIDAGCELDYCEDGGPCYLNLIVVNELRDIGANEYEAPDEEPATGTPEYVTISANNLTKDKTTTITIKELNRIDTKEVHVKASISDLTGRVVRTLYNKTVSSSSSIQLIWDGKNNENKYVGSGVYFLKVHAGPVAKTMKIFLTL